MDQKLTVNNSYDFTKKGKVHFIGIAGSAIAPISVMMKDAGWDVSGSDQNVWEPALSVLTNAKVNWSEGYDAKNVEDADLIVIGGAPLIGNAQNPEYLRAVELRKPILSYGQIVGGLLIKEKSIVVCGSYGKSTTSSMIAKVLFDAGVDPSIMIGGKPVDFTNGVHNSNSKYSVVEGDEYASAFGFDMEPRFVHYKPKYAVLSATKWDHLDLYKTEESYIEAFKKLAKLVEQNEGVLILSASGENNEKIAATYGGELITYMLDGFTNRLSEAPEYLATNIRFEKDVTKFEIVHGGNSLGEFETPLLGLHNVENALATFIACYETDIPLETIKNSLKQFGGIKRRQEIVGNTKSGAIVMDDFAHSPVKAKSTMEAIRTRYKDNKVIVVYMPRLSERGDRKVLEWYKDSFVDADAVLIPKITVRKETAKEDRIRGTDLVQAINMGKNNAIYMPLEEEIVKYINENADQNTLVVFMSAGGWGELMKKVIQ